MNGIRYDQKDLLIKRIAFQHEFLQFFFSICYDISMNFHAMINTKGSWKQDGNVFTTEAILIESNKAKGKDFAD